MPIAISLVVAVVLLLPTPIANAAGIVGTDGDDHIVGTSKRDHIRALGGDDVVSALGGPDSVFAGSGNDTIFGRWGVDFIRGGFGSDEAHGGRGDDTIAMDRGADIATGGRGKDVFIVWHDGLPDEIACGPGIDDVIWEMGQEPQDHAVGCERQFESTRQQARYLHGHPVMPSRRVMTASRDRSSA